VTRDELALLVHELRAPVAALARLAEAVPAARDRGSLGPLITLAVAAGRDVERILRDPSPGAVAREPVWLGELVASAAIDGGDRVEVRAEANPVVEVDPTRIRQALANLVANALRHGERVSLVVGQTGATAHVDVRDDGPGVPEGLDPFARGVGTVGSTGLGLWVARTTVEAHGGSLELLDRGPGAWFRLALPRASGGD
jgi:two-component system OmpR family sensor kinase